MKKRKMIAKLFIGVICSMIFASTSTSVYASNNTTDTVTYENYDITNSKENYLKEVRPYVYVSDGRIYLKSTSPFIYNELQLDKLQDHFDVLNSMVENKEIIINDDLSIINRGITPFATYGSWTFTWWGAERLYTNTQAETLAINIGSFSHAGVVSATQLAPYFPVYAIPLAVTGGYLSLLANRIRANNQGNGVYLGITYVAVFNVEPL